MGWLSRQWYKFLVGLIRWGPEQKDDLELLLRSIWGFESDVYTSSRIKPRSEDPIGGPSAKPTKVLPNHPTLHFLPTNTFYLQIVLTYLALTILSILTLHFLPTICLDISSLDDTIHSHFY